MKSIFRNIILIFIVGITATQGFSQNDLKKANQLYEKKSYCAAIFYYTKFLNYNTSSEAYFKRGICNYECRNLTQSVEDLENSKVLGNYSEEIDLYLAKIYEAKQDFEKAIEYYKKYLSGNLKSDAKRSELLGIIKRCSNGAYLKYKPGNHFTENWGSTINSAADEIVPMQGENETFYFSSNNSNIEAAQKFFKSYKYDFNGGNWKELSQFQSDNTKQNMILLDILPNFKYLFYLGYNLEKGSLFTAPQSNQTFDFNAKSKFEGPIYFEKSYGYLSVVNDSTIIFSADLPGGYGGLDIYLTGKRSGKWIEPINLGPEINSKFDEVSPFMTPDGRYLFFSSNNENSVGGYDIFYSVFDVSAAKWSNPSNIGMPANSSGNEMYFRLLSSGMTGVFSTDRIDQGYGGYDINWLYFRDKFEFESNAFGEIAFLKNKKFNYIINSTPDVQKNVETKEVIVNNEPKNELKVNNQTSKIDSSSEMSHVNVDLKGLEGLLPGDSIKTLEIPNIYFKNQDFLDNNSLIKFLDQLSNIMIRHKNMKVEFIGNSFLPEDNSNEIYSSVRMAQRLSDSLTVRMINKNQIIVKGYGRNFPIAKINAPERSLNVVLKFNNRIDVIVHTDESDKIKTKYQDFYIMPVLFDQKHDLYNSIVEGLTYKVIYKESYFLVSDPLLSKFNDSGIEYFPDQGLYVYTLGIYKEYKKAKELFDKLITNNNPKVKIVPYINGIKLSNDKIIDYAKQYIDLVNYMKDNKKKE